MLLENPEIHVLQLDGFFNALRCLIGHPRKIFGAGFIPKSGRDIDAIVNDSEIQIEASGKLIKKSIVNFDVIQKKLNEKIDLKLQSNNKEHLKNLDWNLIEYYGLLSIAESEDGEWNRLVGQEHILLDYIEEEGNASVIFFVEYDEFVVVTYL